MSPIVTSQLSSVPCLFPKDAYRLNSASPCSSLVYLRPKLPRVPLKPISVKSGYRKAATVCLFGDKGKPQNEASPWKVLENAVGNLNKERSIEDVLRDQMQKQEFYDDGGSDGGKGSNGGGGGGGDGSRGEPQDEDSSETVNEFFQVVLATMGFVFLYALIVQGEEITVLAKDSIRFLFTRQKSIRLKRLINEWKEFIEEMKGEEEVPNWLARDIINTPTSFDSPEKYRRIILDRPELLRDLFLTAENPASHESSEQ